MELTENVKKWIDGMSYTFMLRTWRFAPSGTLIFQGASGDYFAQVMAEKKKTVDHVKISKNIGWGK